MSFLFWSTGNVINQGLLKYGKFEGATVLLTKFYNGRFFSMKQAMGLGYGSCTQLVL